MPCSTAKCNANRQNAKKSTGPKTGAGKAKSSRNALKHGFCAAASSLTPLEDRDAYAAYTRRLVASLHPRTAMEDDLAHRIADLSWRLRRIPDAESALLARDTVHDLAHRCPRDEQREGREDRDEPEGAPGDDERNDDDDAAVLPEPPARLLAAAMSAPRNPYLTLQRYESSLDRARSRALKELRQLQKDRRAHREEEAPVQNEPTSPSRALTPSPLEGAASGIGGCPRAASGIGGCPRAGRGEGEAAELQTAPLQNEPTPPPQATSDQGPVTTREESRNKPASPSVSSVAEPQRQELLNEPKPQTDRPPQIFHLNRSDLRPLRNEPTTSRSPADAPPVAPPASPSAGSPASRTAASKNRGSNSPPSAPG